jgi:hypothetical protein
MTPVQHFSIALRYLTVTNWHSEADVFDGCQHQCGLRLKKHEPIMPSSSPPHVNHTTLPIFLLNSAHGRHTAEQEGHSLDSVCLLEPPFQCRCLAHVRRVLGQITRADKASTLAAWRIGVDSILYTMCVSHNRLNHV